MAYGVSGRLGWSATAAYVGARGDLDTDAFPAKRVRLGDYALGSVRLGWDLGRGVEAYGRVANAFGSDYEDVLGYRTPGRTVHAGLRLRLGS
jgi:vitamin B12 transporter